MNPSRPPGQDLHLNPFENTGTQVFYWGCEKQCHATGLLNVDPTSFVAIEKHYGKDKSQVFSGDRAIPDADTETFAFFEGSMYARDKDFVFFNGEMVVGADLKTFQVLAYPYSLDQKLVYSSGQPLPSIDRAFLDPAALIPLSRQELRQVLENR